MRKLVNEQTEIGLLLAVPGLIVTIVLAPWVIQIFFTGAFSQAADLLRWFVFGCLGRVVSWPMGFIMLAKGNGRLFLITETVFGLIHVALLWVGLKVIGLTGVAMAFLTLYTLHTIGMLLVSRHLIDFCWSKGVVNLLGILFPFALVTFLSALLLPVIAATIMGSAICLIVCLYCLRQLGKRLGLGHRICRVIEKVPGGKWVLG